MHVRRKSWLRTLSALALAVSAAGAATADPVADFYKGKTVSLIAGFPPGGGYDTYVRVLARHYGRFLPGNPTVVASNMPGAGSLTAANNIYAKFAPDGLALAMFASSAAMEPLIGNKAALFDATRFSWVGSMSQDVAYCGVWQHPGGATTFDEMLTKETIIGGGAPAAITYQHPMVLKNVLKANFKVIQGYKGTRDINIAMQRGEVNGTCGMFGSSVKAQFGAEVADGRMKLFIQMGSKRSDEFGKIPSVFDYAKTDEDRAILQFHFGQLLLGRPLAGPPGIPADRAEGAARRAVRDHEGPAVPGGGDQGRPRHRPGLARGGRQAAQAVRVVHAGDSGEGEGRHGAVTARATRMSVPHRGRAVARQQPSRTPIYFGVDFDLLHWTARETDRSISEQRIAIKRYFEYVREGRGNLDHEEIRARHREILIDGGEHGGAAGGVAVGVEGERAGGRIVDDTVIGIVRRRALEELRRLQRARREPGEHRVLQLDGVVHHYEIEDLVGVRDDRRHVEAEDVVVALRQS